MSRVGITVVIFAVLLVLFVIYAPPPRTVICIDIYTDCLDYP